MLQVRGQQVRLGRDVAALYGVETRIINQAVKNNPDKFPAGYAVELTQRGITDLRSKILTAIVMPDLSTAGTESLQEINFLIGKKAVGCGNLFVAFWWEFWYNLTRGDDNEH